MVSRSFESPQYNKVEQNYICGAYNIQLRNVYTRNTVLLLWIRAARYEENMRYAITLLNVAITVLFAINKQILKCTQCCLSAAVMLLKYNTVLVD